MYLWDSIDLYQNVSSSVFQLQGQVTEPALAVVSSALEQE